MTLDESDRDLTLPVNGTHLIMQLIAYKPYIAGIKKSHR